MNQLTNDARIFAMTAIAKPPKPEPVSSKSSNEEGTAVTVNPDLYLALQLRSVETKRPIEDFVDEAIRAEFRIDLVNFAELELRAPALTGQNPHSRRSRAIAIDPTLRAPLEHRTANTGETTDEVVDTAVRELIREDIEDLKAFDEAKPGEGIPLEQLLDEMNRDGEV
ncbi:MAG: hypothetical protein ACI8UO_006189 [Verrucomicrobiales bacterium]